MRLFQNEKYDSIRPCGEQLCNYHAPVCLMDTGIITPVMG